jgi:hypothetical protein
MAELLEAVGVRPGAAGAKVTAAEAGGAGARLTWPTTVASRSSGCCWRRAPAAHCRLGLDALGLWVEPGQPVEVDEHCHAVGTDNVWAVGDVNGIASFTHTAHYQGGSWPPTWLAGRWGADYRGVPRAIYTTPVLAAVGHTEASPAPPGSTRRARSGSSLPGCPPEPERAFRH